MQQDDQGAVDTSEPSSHEPADTAETSVPQVPEPLETQPEEQVASETNSAEPSASEAADSQAETQGPSEQATHGQAESQEEFRPRTTRSGRKVVPPYRYGLEEVKFGGSSGEQDDAWHHAELAQSSSQGGGVV
jgi:hypothetical protein